MGRRRERGGFGRRQVLQLNDNRREDSPYRGQGGQWPVRNEANALSGLMAHYGESEESDEDEDLTPPPSQAASSEMLETPPPEPEEAVPAKEVSRENGHPISKGRPSLDIDSKVANFLAEIDAMDEEPPDDIDGEPLAETDGDPIPLSDLAALTAPPPPPPEEPSSMVPEDEGEDGLEVTDPESGEEMEEDQEEESGEEEQEAEAMPAMPTAPMTVWQHCQDENTQYYYYWNTMTNEVTWEIPLEYSQYLLQMKEYEEALSRYEVRKAEIESQVKEKKTKKTKRKKVTGPEKPSNGSVQDTEAAPTSEEALPTHNVEKKPIKSWLLKKIRETYGSKYDLPTDKDTGGTSESAIENKDQGELMIGPQLPPVMAGPDKEVDEEVLIGPQLPSGAGFASFPPPEDLYGPAPGPVHDAASMDEAEGMAPMIGPQLPKELEGHRETSQSADLPGPASTSMHEAEVMGEQAANLVPPHRTSTQDEDNAESSIIGPHVAPQKETEEDKGKVEDFNDKDHNDGGNGDGNDSDVGDEDEDEEDLDFIDKQLEAPLISQYVKKKPGEDSEAKHQAEPTAAPRPQEKQEAVEEEEQEEEEDVEFDIDDIDQELDAAMEKKKAEEKKLQLEEATPAVVPQKKRKTLEEEPEKSKKLKTTEAEPPAPVKKKMDKEEIKTRAEVADLATVVTDKLEFLDITRKGLSKLQVLLVEIETRIVDWREGALRTPYLLGRLQEAELQLQQYEASAAPPGWACHWDRTYKRYFYFNLTTGASQWDYPDDDGSNGAKSETGNGAKTAGAHVTKSDAHSTAVEGVVVTPPGEKAMEANHVSSSQGEGPAAGPASTDPAPPPPQYSHVDSTTISVDVSTAVTSTASVSSETISSSMAESTTLTGSNSSAFPVDPSLFQDLFAPAPPPPAEPPPPGVEATPSSLTQPRPPPGLAASTLPLSRSPPPPPPGTTPPPGTADEVDMEIDATTSSLLAAAPPPPPPLQDATSTSGLYQVASSTSASLDTAAHLASAAAAPPPPPPPSSAVIMGTPFISSNTAGMPLPVPPVHQATNMTTTIVAPPVRATGTTSAVSVPSLPPPPPPPFGTPPDTPPRSVAVAYDPTLDGVPMVEAMAPPASAPSSLTSSTAPATSSTSSSSSQVSASSSSSSSSSSAVIAAAQAKEKKKKKEKKSAMGLSLKKKKLPSLVAKWQEVQEAVEREASKHVKDPDSP